MDAVYGFIIGGAVGDALGAPVEGCYYTEIREQYGRVSEFVDTNRDNAPDGPRGVTDDTTLAHYISLAIVRKGGRITPDDLAQVWLEKGENRRFWINERVTLWKLKAGMSPWDSGLGNIPAGCAMMAIGPIGVINAGNPAQAYQDAFHIAFVNQEGVNRQPLFEELEGDRTANFYSLAQRLVDALRNERRALAERIDTLGKILG